MFKSEKSHDTAFIICCILAVLKKENNLFMHSKCPPCLLLLFMMSSWAFPTAFHHDLLKETHLLKKLRLNGFNRTTVKRSKPMKIKSVPETRLPLWDLVLSFSHTFSPQSTRVGGPHLPNGSMPTRGKSWIRH